MAVLHVILVSILLALNVRNGETLVAPLSKAEMQQTVDEVFQEALPSHSLDGYNSSIPMVPNFHELVPLPRRESMVQKEARLAELSFDVLNRLSKRLQLSRVELLSSEKWMSEVNLKFREICQPKFTNITCERESPYRTIDGSCNNLGRPSWGMAGVRQKRFMHSHYEDGLDSPRSSASNGRPLPSPRTISNVIHKAQGVAPLHHRLSAVMVTWGQFIKHDISSTPLMRSPDGTSFDCCGKDKSSTSCFSVKIEQPDPAFKNTCMNVARSSPAVGPLCTVGEREQMNKVTAYLDGSGIYGSSKEEEIQLRAFKNGLLREGSYELLPANGKHDCIRKHTSDHCQLTGDERSNVVPSVAALHTLFMREHNRIAKKLKEINENWQDERLYQEARKLVGALLQHITYNEYIPEILGHDLMTYYGLMDTEFGHNHVYDEMVNAGIANVFAAAAMRFGHSTIPSQQTYIGPKFKKRRGVDIENTFHKPYYLLRYRNYGYEGLMRWLITDEVPDIDRNFENGVRDNLFKHGNISSDLASINIQRGRDHGLESYNSWREWCGLPVARTFDELDDHDTETAGLLALVYQNTKDIDLYTGGLSEIHVDGGNVGPTFACILAHQFQDLKFGDRFWYENLDDKIGFTTGQLDSIKQIQLGKIICSNMDIPDIQRDVFNTPVLQTHLRRHVLCERLPDLDFNEWAQEKQRWWVDASETTFDVQAWPDSLTHNVGDVNAQTAVEVQMEQVSNDTSVVSAAGLTVETQGENTTNLTSVDASEQRTVQAPIIDNVKESVQKNLEKPPIKNIQEIIQSNLEQPATVQKEKPQGTEIIQKKLKQPDVQQVVQKTLQLPKVQDILKNIPQQRQQSSLTWSY